MFRLGLFQCWKNCKLLLQMNNSETCTKCSKLIWSIENSPRPFNSFFFTNIVAELCTSKAWRNVSHHKWIFAMSQHSKISDDVYFYYLRNFQNALNINVDFWLHFPINACRINSMKMRNWDKTLLFHWTTPFIYAMQSKDFSSKTAWLSSEKTVIYFLVYSSFCIEPTFFQKLTMMQLCFQVSKFLNICLNINFIIIKVNSSPTIF